MSKSKRSQGDIVATLMIILIVIIAGGVLLRFLIPEVQKWLAPGDCFQFNGKINIINDPTYTCYDAATNSLYMKIGFGDFDDNSKNKVTGLVFLIDSGENRFSYEFYPPNSNPPGISLLNGDIGNLPEKNQERTYRIMNITIKPNSTMIYPLIDRKRKCGDTNDEIDFIPFCQTGFMGLNTSSFISGGYIPTPFSSPTVDPKITITNMPSGTATLAIFIYDINDSTTPHGAYYNIPNTITTIDLGAVGIPAEVYTPLNNTSFSSPVTHYYTFTVYAINNTLSGGLTKQQALSAINKTNKLGQAKLYGKIKGA